MTNDTLTKTVESGAFVRTMWRHGTKRSQKTKRMHKSTEKVVIGHVGDFELYVYPFKFPDSVFLGAYPVSTNISSSNVTELMTAFNRVKWFLDGNWQNEPNWRNAPNSRRRDIQKSYNEGLNALKASNNARKRL